MANLQNITILVRKGGIDLSDNNLNPSYTQDDAVLIDAEYAELHEASFIEFLPAGTEDNHKTLDNIEGKWRFDEDSPEYDIVEFWPSAVAKEVFPERFYRDFS